MHISILVPRGPAVLSSIVGPFKIFSGVNQYLIDSGQRADPFYKIDLVGLSGETLLYDGIFSIRPTKQIHEIDHTDLIIITTIIGDIPHEIERNHDFLPWIRERHERDGTEVASLCLGAFLLAASGLIDGRACSTHWAFAEMFEMMFPRVDLQPHKIITEDSGIYSSGGSYSFLNLILHLIHKYNGKDAATWAAKMYEIETDRTNQGPFFIFQGQKSHDDKVVREIQDYLEKNYQDPFNLDDLSRMFNLSKRNLMRRFKKATHNTPLQYLQRIKMEAAKRHLEKTNQSIMEIMYQTGYNDVKSFRQIFKKVVGIAPSTYRNRYGRA